MTGARSLLVLINVLLASNKCISQFNVGCSSYGCNPSGTFSFALKVPKSKASIAWTTEDLFIGPVPFATGCVGNKDNVLCPSNGPRDVSYISLYIETGGLVWRDFLLRFPQLPVTDSDGNIYGSDGHFLVIFDVDGHFKKQVQLEDTMFPSFSAKMTSNNIIFLASKNGHIQTFHPDGSSHASISLFGSIKNTNGTFLPVSTPAVAGNRVYVLTKFNASSNSKKVDEDNYRLFLFDVLDGSDHLKIAYYLDFEKNSTVSFNGLYEVENKNGKIVRIQSKESIQDNFQGKTVFPDILEPRVMSNNGMNNVYVNIPRTKTTGTLFALEDKGKNSNVSLLFKIQKSLRKISMFMVNSDPRDINIVGEEERQGDSSKLKNHGHAGILWGLESNKEVIIGIDSSAGKIISAINISVILGERFNITSEIMVVRKDENSSTDNFVFGIKKHTTNPTSVFLRLCHELGVHGNATSYLVYLTGNRVSWMVPSPRDLEIMGQIVGIPNRLFNTYDRNSWKLKDLLVIFAGNQTSSVVFGVW